MIATMKHQTVPAGKFKAECLRLLDRVAETHEILIVTKRGRPVAQIGPVKSSRSKPLLGSATVHGDIAGWMKEALDLPLVELLAVTPAIGIKAAEFPSSFAGDPAARLIAATAILESALLITKDQRIQDSGVVRTAW